MHEIMGINDYTWIEKLIGEQGIMRIVVEDWTIVNKVDTKKENKKEKVKF